jgi:hypothetical protein
MSRHRVMGHTGEADCMCREFCSHTSSRKCQVCHDTARQVRAQAAGCLNKKQRRLSWAWWHSELRVLKRQADCVHLIVPRKANKSESTSHNRNRERPRVSESGETPAWVFLFWPGKDRDGGGRQVVLRRYSKYLSLGRLACLSSLKQSQMRSHEELLAPHKLGTMSLSTPWHLLCSHTSLWCVRLTWEPTNQVLTIIKNDFWLQLANFC